MAWLKKYTVNPADSSVMPEDRPFFMARTMVRPLK